MRETRQQARAGFLSCPRLLYYADEKLAHCESVVAVVVLVYYRNPIRHLTIQTAIILRKLSLENKLVVAPLLRVSQSCIRKPPPMASPSRRSGRSDKFRP